MKKILIGSICVLLLVLCSFTLIKGIHLGFINLDGISEIKQKSSDLNSNLEMSKELVKKTYPSKLEELTTAIKSLTTTKEKYEATVASVPNIELIGTTQITKYKVEFLWTKIGNYATKEGITLTMDIKNGSDTNIYNLNFSIVGSYTAIISFIYDIENDDDLNFKIANFNMASTSGDGSTTSSKTSTTENQSADSTNTESTENSNSKTKSSTKSATSTLTSSGDGSKLQATFNVEDVAIELD